MSQKQWDRIRRMRSQPLYLIDATYMEGTLIPKYIVSGATGSIYTVTLQQPRDDVTYNRDDITCTCPDYSGHARTANVVCKHCCYVLERVLNCRSSASADVEQPFTITKVPNRPSDVCCPICLEGADDNTDENEQMTQCDGCKQFIHVTCVEVWLRRRVEYGAEPNCPLCRHAWK